MIRWAIPAVLLAVSVPATAHRGHATLSVVEIDAATGKVTVTHSMAAHDAEPALVRIAPDIQPNLDEPAALRALTGYVARRFILNDAGGRRVALTLASTQLRGDDVRLIYRGQIAPPAATVTVDSRIFTEIHRDQENQVNVRRARVTRTAVFRGSSDAETIRFAAVDRK